MQAEKGDGLFVGQELLYGRWRCFERFFFVTAREPFPVEPIVSAARRLAAGGAAERAPLELPATLSATTVLLEKEAP